MGLEVDSTTAEKQTPTEQPLLPQAEIQKPVFIDDSQIVLKTDLNTSQHGSKYRGLFFQIFATLIANLMAITDGIAVGWTAPMIPYFLSDRTHIVMTERQAEWLEHWLLIGALCGLPSTMYFVDKIGRKKSILLSTSILAGAWVVIGCTTKIEFLYAARFTTGVFLNMAYVAAPMYIAEIADKRHRGFLSSLIFVMMLTGVLTIYCLGPFVPYYVTSVIAGILLLIEVAVFSFLPESPYYLLMNNDVVAAVKSLQTFRSNTSIEYELKEISEGIKQQQSEKQRPLDIIRVKSNRKALIIMFVLNAAQLLGSIEVIIMNLHEILDSAGSVYMKSSHAAILFSALMLVAGIVTSFTVDRFGRKVLLIISSILSGFSLLILAIYFTLKKAAYEHVKSISWIPIASVMAFAIVFKAGLGMIPIVITAEIFSVEVKSIGMSLSDAIYVTMSLIALQIYHFLKIYGMHYPFYIFSFCLFSTSVFVTFFIPETKGKTLHEIQQILKGEYEYVPNNQLGKSKTFNEANDRVDIELKKH